METQSNTPEGKVTAEEILKLYKKETDRHPHVNPVCHGELFFASHEFEKWLIEKIAALHSSDLTRQLESAREELERLRERLDDFGETEKCECDHTTPIVFNTHDDDGNATCPNCQIDYLNELITKEEEQNKALVEALENSNRAFWHIEENTQDLKLCDTIRSQITWNETTLSTLSKEKNP